MSLFSFCLSWFQTIEIQVVPTHSSSELSSVATDGGKIQQSGLRKHERSGPGGGPGSFSHRVKNICSWGSSHRVKNICSSLCPLAWLSHFPNACFSFYHSVTQPPWFFFFVCLFSFSLISISACQQGKKGKHNLKVENYVLFGRHTKDLSQDAASQVVLRVCFEEIREESGCIGVFATKTK